MGNNPLATALPGGWKSTDSVIPDCSVVRSSLLLFLVTWCGVCIIFHLLISLRFLRKIANNPTIYSHRLPLTATPPHCTKAFRHPAWSCTTIKRSSFVVSCFSPFCHSIIWHFEASGLWGRVSCYHWNSMVELNYLLSTYMVFGFISLLASGPGLVRLVCIAKMSVLASGSDSLCFCIAFS